MINQNNKIKIFDITKNIQIVFIKKNNENRIPYNQ